MDARKLTLPNEKCSSCGFKIKELSSLLADDKQKSLTDLLQYAIPPGLICYHENKAKYLVETKCDSIIDTNLYDRLLDAVKYRDYVKIQSKKNKKIQSKKKSKKIRS